MAFWDLRQHWTGQFGNCTQDAYILVECVREVEETLVGIGNKKDLGQLKYYSSYAINKTNIS